MAMAEAGAIGRARTVLVSGDGPEAIGVLAMVTAHVAEKPGPSSVDFCGPVQCTNEVAQHVSSVVLPIVVRIVDGLNVARTGFVVSISNVGAASASDLGVHVAGFSADVPVFLAMLSAALHMPLPQELLSTGHVGSAGGDIRWVRALPSKLAAARLDPAIRRFVHPALEDASVDALAPETARAAARALCEASERLHLTAVADVFDLVRNVFDAEAIVAGALARGFFIGSTTGNTDGDPLGRTIEYLTARNEDRFWSVLERHLLAHEPQYARQLVAARVRLAIEQRSYPQGFGRQLLALQYSLPPATRREIHPPLLPARLWIDVSQFASDADLEDARMLVEICQPDASAPICRPRADTAPDETPSPAEANVQAVVDALAVETSAERLFLPVDAARASYALGSITARSHEEFIATISAFYVHLLRHTRRVPAEVNPASVTEDAVELVARAFARRGGLEGAWAEARDALHGGLRIVLDAMSDQYKQDAQGKHVFLVLKEAFDSMDWDARTAFVGALLARLRPHLPPELQDTPPESFARRPEVLVQAYVASLDEFKAVLRTF